MSNTRFEKLWNLLHKCGEVEFSSNGEVCSLHIIPGRYGNEFSLRAADGDTILAHHNKERFREILVD